MTKTESKKNGIGLKPVGIGMACGVIIIALVLLLCAVLISGEKVPETFGGTAICIGAFLGTFGGGFLAGKRNKGAYVLMGIIVASGLFLLRMVIAAFGTEGELFDTTALMLLIFMLLGGFTGGLLSGKKKHKRKKK